MRFDKTLLIAAILLLACIVSVGAAHAEPQMQFEILTTDELTDSSRAPPIYGDVRQDETDTHSYYIDGNKKTFEVSLNWDRGSNDNDLDLQLHLPNGNILEFQDQDDGQYNGKITARMSVTSQFANAYWSCSVDGARVIGIQPYTLTMNSY